MSFAVNTQATCSWTVNNRQLPWIGISSASQFTGPGTAVLTFAPNTGAARSTTVGFGDTWVLISQAAASF